MDNLEDDVGSDEARLRLGQPDTEHEDVEERRGPLEDGQEALTDGEDGGERGEAGQADGGLQLGHDVAAGLDLSLDSNHIILSRLPRQAGGEDEHPHISQDQNQSEGNPTERESSVLTLAASQVVVDDVDPCQDEEEAGERSTPAKELGSFVQRKFYSEQRHFLLLISRVHPEVSQYSLEFRYRELAID